MTELIQQCHSWCVSGDRSLKSPVSGTSGSGSSVVLLPHENKRLQATLKKEDWVRRCFRTTSTSPDRVPLGAVAVPPLLMNPTCLLLDWLCNCSFFWEFPFKLFCYMFFYNFIICISILRYGILSIGVCLVLSSHTVWLQHILVLTTFLCVIRDTLLCVFLHAYITLTIVQVKNKCDNVKTTKLKPMCSFCFRGPQDTCFEGGVFPAVLSFPSDYPLSPPKMRFTCEMFHPNSEFHLPQILAYLINLKCMNRPVCRDFCLKPGTTCLLVRNSSPASSNVWTMPQGRTSD